MIRRATLPLIVLALAYGFWFSSTFGEIAAGVALFLFGMLCMEQGFKAFTGGALEKLLRKSTENTWKSLSFGVVTTTIMQSSSLVSVITISFLSAGLLGLAAGIGIIFGANLGTTTGAWIVAGFGLKVKLSAYALPMLVFGVLLVFQPGRGIKGAGWILVGFGFLFLGIHYMKEGFAGFADQLDLTRYAMGGVIGLLVYTGFGILATVVMQSSHATLVLIITALGAGQVTYDNALALAIGSNIGTTVTAVIGAISAPVQGKRLAAAHLLFNVGTGLIALLLINPFVVAVDWISAKAGIPADDFTLKLAVFHTLFNLVGVTLFTPFVHRLAAWLPKVLKSDKPTHDVPRYLSDASLELPDVALTALRRETQHLFDNAFSIIAHGVNLRRSDIESDMDLQAFILPPGEVIDIDIDHQYGLMIKDIYSANVEFYSHAAVNADEVILRQMQALWQVNRDIVAAIKAVKHLRKNLNQHSRSKNVKLRKEYNRFRVRIGELLREIASLREEDSDVVTLLSVDALKVGLRDGYSFNDRAFGALIRNGDVSAQMGTSMINDSRYVRDVLNHLLGVVEGLIQSAAEGDDVSVDLSLTNDEIEQVADQAADREATASGNGPPI